MFLHQEHCLLSSDSLQSFAFLYNKSSQATPVSVHTWFSATKEDLIVTVFNDRNFDFLGSSAQFLRAVGNGEQFVVRQGLLFASRRRNRVLGLGLSNSRRGPWALDCPTAYNDSKCVTVGLTMVSKKVACQRQWKRQVGVFIKAGPAVRSK